MSKSHSQIRLPLAILFVVVAICAISRPLIQWAYEAYRVRRAEEQAREEAEYYRTRPNTNPIGQISDPNY